MFDIMAKKKWFFAFSLLVTIPGLIFIFLTPITGGNIGLKFSIDYTGGTLWEFKFADANVTPEQVKAVFVEQGLADTTVVRTEGGYLLARTEPVGLRGPEAAPTPTPVPSAAPSTSPAASSSAAPSGSPAASGSVAPGASAAVSPGTGTPAPTSSAAALGTAVPGQTLAPASPLPSSSPSTGKESTSVGPSLPR